MSDGQETKEPPREEPPPEAQPIIYCRRCGYELAGLSEPRCPECGQPFDPANRRTFLRRPKEWALKRWARRSAFVLASLILTGGAALGWLYWGWHVEQDAIGMVRQAGGTCRTERIAPEWVGRLLGPRRSIWLDRATEVRLSGAGTTDSQVALLRRLSRLRVLWLDGSRITDAGLVHLEEMRGLEELNLAQAPITDAGLARLEGLSKLCSLWLAYNRNVTDEGIRHLRHLPKLEGVSLGYTGITDRSLEDLARLPGLQSIGLTGTAITDRGLQHLSQARGLKGLLLGETNVTRAGVEQLRQALPGCEIVGPKP